MVHYILVLSIKFNFKHSKISPLLRKKDIQEAYQSASLVSKLQFQWQNLLQKCMQKQLRKTAYHKPLATSEYKEVNNTHTTTT